MLFISSAIEKIQMLDNSSSPSTFYVPATPRISSILCPFTSNIEGKLVQDYVHTSGLCAYFSLTLIFLLSKTRSSV